MRLGPKALIGLGRPSALRPFDPTKGGGGWTPAALGANALAWVEARRGDKVTQSGGVVSAVTDIISGTSLVQSVGSAKPLYNATGINGRPSIDFDGIDDEMTYAGVWLPVTTVKCRIWTLVRQDALVADTTTQTHFNYGAASAAGARAARRTVLTGVNRSNGATDNAGSTANANNATVDFSGPHVTLTDINGATLQQDVDGTAGTPAAAVTTSTGTVRTRLGATTNTTPVGFGKFGFAALLVDDGSAAAIAQNANILRYLKALGGIS